MKNYNKFYKQNFSNDSVYKNEVGTDVYRNEVDSSYESGPDEESTGPFYAKISNCNKVYLRSDSNKDSEWIKILDKDTEVIVEDWNEYWYKVFTNSGAEGFVMKDFVEIED